MGIKYNEEKKCWEVSYSKRHRLTKRPYDAKRTNIKSKAEANRIYAELVIQVNEKIKLQTIPKWSALLESYYKHLSCCDLSNNTTYNRQKILDFHTLEIWGDRFVDSIATSDIYSLLNSDNGGYSESHKKFIVKCIKGAFDFAFSQGHINRNPTPLIKFKVNDKIQDVLTEPQIKLFLQKAQEFNWPWYPHCATAIYTGMRNGELYALAWDNVDLGQKTIKVNCSWSSKEGFKSTKSGDDRILEIPEPLLPLLRELKVKSADSVFVLPRLSKWDKGEQARELRMFLLALGLPQIRFHDLRASWATWLLSKGVAPSKVMSMGGWKDMDTMMIYVRKAGIDIKGATSVLDNIKTHGIAEAKIIEMK